MITYGAISLQCLPLQDLRWGGLDFAGSFNPPVPRRRCGTARLCFALCRSCCVATGDGFWLAPVAWVWSSEQSRWSGGSWDGAGLLQLAWLEPMQPVRVPYPLPRARLPWPRRRTAFRAPGAERTKQGEKRRPPPAKTAKGRREPEPLLQEP